MANRGPPSASDPTRGGPYDERPAREAKQRGVHRHGGHEGGPAYDGPRHFDYKPLRTEAADGVWASAAANMRTYLLLKERAAAFRSDPEVQEALAAAGVPDLAVPTLAEGETLDDLLTDPGAFEDIDPAAKGDRAHGATRLDQLALEHLLGAR